MYEQMVETRINLEGKFDAMKREFEIKMAGRPGMGFYEAGAIDTLKEKMIYREQETTHLLEQNAILNQKMKDIEEDIDSVESINEVIKNDEKITSMISKFKEAINEGEGVQSLIKRNRDSTIAELQKLKEDLDMSIVQVNMAIMSNKEKIEEDMKAHCNDLTEKIAETKQWVTNHVDSRDGMPRLAPLVSPNEDKLDAILMHLKSLQKEGSGKEDKGRQGEDK